MLCARGRAASRLSEGTNDGRAGKWAWRPGLPSPAVRGWRTGWVPSIAQGLPVRLALLMFLCLPVFLISLSKTQHQYLRVSHTWELAWGIRDAEIPEEGGQNVTC